MATSPIRNSILAATAIAALSACGGHAFVPSQGGFSNSPAWISDAANPCYTAAVQPAWIFKGSCMIFTLPSKGITITLKPYKGITEIVTLPPNTSKGAKWVLADAVGGTDISKWKGKAFPLVPSTIGKSVLYVEAVNSQAGLKFTKAYLIFTTKKKAFPGKTCALSLLQKHGTKFSWLKTPVSAPVKSGAVTYKIPFSSLGVFFPTGLPVGPLYFNTSCK